jgi:hypothetical protein
MNILGVTTAMSSPLPYLLDNEMHAVLQSHVKMGPHPLHTMPGGKKQSELSKCVSTMLIAVVEKDTGQDVKCASRMPSNVVQRNTVGDFKCCNVKNKKLMTI